MKTKTLTIQDPREFDGDPYQVAERAIQQLRGVIHAAQEVMPATDLMARNAELERLLATKQPLGDNAAAAWRACPQGRLLTGIEENLAEAEKALKVLERAVAYNPKAR